MPTPTAKPFRFWLTRGLLAFVLLTLLLGSVYQYASLKNDEAAYPPLGQLYTVDGLALHLYCLGQGRPTILLEAGAGNYSLNFGPLQKRLATFTRVCAYDRPGYGWSAPAPGPQTPQQVAERLHALLAAAGEAPPYLLAGHSIGGVYAKAFTHLYRAEVAGLVLIDSSMEGQGPRLQQPEPSFDALSALLWVCRLTTPFGLPRALGLAAPFVAQAEALYRNTTPLSPAELQMFTARSYTYHFCATVLDMQAETTQMGYHLSPPAYNFGDLPLVVLVGLKNFSTPDPAAGLTPAMLAAAKTGWLQIQTENAQLSTQSQLILVENAGHFIHVDQPDLVVNTLRELAAATP